MSNKTTVKDMGLGGALALIILWILGFYQPELVSSLPIGGEAAIALVIAAIFSYFKESKQ